MVLHVLNDNGIYFMHCIFLRILLVFILHIEGSHFTYFHFVIHAHRFFLLRQSVHLLGKLD